MRQAKNEGGLKMVIESVSLKELKEEIAAMMAVCFEGKIESGNDCLILTFPSGQSFRIGVFEH